MTRVVAVSNMPTCQLYNWSKSYSVHNHILAFFPPFIVIPVLSSFLGGKQPLACLLGVQCFNQNDGRSR